MHQCLAGNVRLFEEGAKFIVKQIKKEGHELDKRVELDFTKTMSQIGVTY